MSELERLKAEIERQDRELELRFEELAQLDPGTELAVSAEWMSDFSAPAATLQHAPRQWAIRG